METIFFYCLNILMSFAYFDSDLAKFDLKRSSEYGGITASINLFNNNNHCYTFENLEKLSSLQIASLDPKKVGFYLADKVLASDLNNYKKNALGCLLLRKQYPAKQEDILNNYKKIYDNNTKLITQSNELFLNTRNDELQKNGGRRNRKSSTESHCSHRRTWLHRHSNNNNPSRSKKRRVLGKHTRRRLY
jgi:hypothetical protein